MKLTPGDDASAKSTGMLRIWHPADLGSIELRLGTDFHHPYPRHWHDEFLISGIIGGSGYFQYRGNDHLTASGSLFLVAPGEVHANYACDEGVSFRSIYIPAELVMNAASDITQRASSLTRFFSGVIPDARLMQSFLGLHRQLEESGTRLHQESLLLKFLAELIPRISKEPAHSPAIGRESAAVRRAQEYLNDHYAREVSLSELAVLANLSPYHFHRTFCRQTGMPPHSYQLQVRIARATGLIRENRPLAQVASAAGFFDQSHLTRHFKRFVGVTPAQYLRHSKNVQDLATSPS
jgi:AraC-like DNA-binding protein